MHEPALTMPDLARPQVETLRRSGRDASRTGILMAISHFPPAIGGTERQAHALAAGLAAAGHRVTVLTLERPGVPARELWDGVVVERALNGRGRGVIYAITYGMSLLRHLRRLRPGHAILHAHHLYLEAMIAVLMKHLTSMPTLAKVACGGSDGDFARLHRIGGTVMLPLLRRLDRVVAVSREIRNELTGHGFIPEHIVEIPNGVDTHRFAPAADPQAAQLQTGLGPETVLFLGRLDAQKGLDTALAAWARVAGRRPAARLFLAGDGPARGPLEERARELRLGERVRFLGPRLDPERLLQASQVFVLPSRSEGMSNALLEAMATGLPCVASRIGGNSDLVKHGVTGLLSPPADAVTLADMLCALLEDGSLRYRLGTAARTAVIEQYGMDRVVREYTKLYATLTGALA